MADTAVAITAGSGTNIDTRTESTNSNHRQVIVIGDPSTNAGVAPVDVTKGLAVDLTATGANTTAVKVNVASGGIASGAVASGAFASGSIADGADVNAGATSDAASATTTMSGKLRGIATALGVTALDRGTGAGGAATLRVTVDNAQISALGQAAASASQPVVQASDRQNSVTFAVAMTTDTSIYASGDLIADTQQLDAFFNKTDGKGVINSITIIEKDAIGAAYYILFHRTSTSMGTENSAPNISDANAAAGIQGIVAVATSDFVTVSGTKIACIKNIGVPVSAVSGTDDLYVSILNATGTPTYAGGTIDLIIGGLLD